MAQPPDSLEQYRAIVLDASVKFLRGLGLAHEFPATHDPADIVLDTLDLAATTLGETP